MTACVKVHSGINFDLCPVHRWPSFPGVCLEIFRCARCLWFLLSSSFGLCCSQEGLCNSLSVFEVRKQPSPRLWAFQLSVQPKPTREPKSAEGKRWFWLWFWHISQCIIQGCFLMQRGVLTLLFSKDSLIPFLPLLRWTVNLPSHLTAIYSEKEKKNTKNPKMG